MVILVDIKNIKYYEAVQLLRFFLAVYQAPLVSICAVQS